MLDTCSIIIPTYNASKYLHALLKTLESQTVKDYELIIIDSSSSDNTTDIAASYKSRIITIEKSEFDHGESRTLAAKTAKGTFMIFLSQDCQLYDTKSIENIIRPFIADEQIAAVYGRQLPYPDASIFAQHLRLFNYPDISYIRTLADRKKFGIRTAFFSNSFSAYRKTALENIGYFKKGLIFGEDMDAAARLLLNNKQIAYAASAIVLHSHNYSIAQDFKRYFDMGVFHRKEKWLLKEFGKAEGQAIQYIKSEIHFLIEHKRFDMFFLFTLRMFSKYLGYQLGRRYVYLPESLNRRCSFNPLWWDKQKDT